MSDDDILFEEEEGSSTSALELPLIGSRGYYIHPHNNTCIYGANWGKLEQHTGESNEEEEEELPDANHPERALSITDEELDEIVRSHFGYETDSSEEEKEEQEAEHGLEDERSDDGDSFSPSMSSLMSAPKKIPMRESNINEIIEHHECSGGGRRSGMIPLLGRVVHKSKVIHYAKPTDRRFSRYPFKTQLTVCMYAYIEPLCVGL